MTFQPSSSLKAPEAGASLARFCGLFRNDLFFVGGIVLDPDGYTGYDPVEKGNTKTPLLLCVYSSRLHPV